ncbi:hypothetical protein SAMN04487861_10810 [Selenomonas ruminantium]|uniref:Uncharacterized protein n=1 Tax=Selenomonas ruminantium TaxID=971 RepID=A0A1I3DV13_SELRU|nr:hypothetical protein [Selenomonas ruminantium]SFH90572.1 hypothetical protein SAMN04487861_10810 [Selenomonas ruminantium]
MRKLLFLLCLSLFVHIGSADAMSLRAICPLLGFSNHNGIAEDCSGPDNGEHWAKLSNFNGKEVNVKIRVKYYHDYGIRKNAGGTITVSCGREMLSFPVKKDESAKVQIMPSTDKREFLLIRTYQDAADGSSACMGMWLVGEKDGKLLTYATLDTVENAGLLFDDISPTIKNGELWLTGTAKVYWGADPQAPPRPLSSKYNGVPVKVDGNYCTINSAVLFWDSAAQWFGIRMEN